MRSQHIRTLGLIVGLIAVLGIASIAAGESLTDQQIGRQIERRLSEDAFSNVNVSIQVSVVSLSSTVPNLWAKEAALAKARELVAVTSVVSDALDIGELSDPLPAEELPVSLERIKRKLPQVGSAQSSLLRLDYYVEVYGRAPKIDVLQAFDVHNGPVPYGAPTHADLLSLILPPESRTPPLLLSPGIDIIGWTLETGARRESRGYQAAPAPVSVAPAD